MSRSQKRAKAFWIFTLVVIFLIATAAIWTEEAAPKAEPAEENKGEAGPEGLQARIAKLIDQLGAEDFERRDAAQKELMEIGDPAREQLTKACKHSDMEIASRARDLLKELELARVTLIVTDKHNKPIAGKKIRVILTGSGVDASMDPESEKATQIEIEEILPENGRLRLPSREPGDYNIKVEVEGYRRQELGMTLAKAYYLRRVVAYRGGDIKGKIVDIKNDNKPLHNVRVSVSAEGEKKEATTNQNGEFLLENLPPRRVNLDIQCERRLVREGGATVEVMDEETTEITIEMMEEKWFYGTIRGKILRPDGKPFDAQFNAVLMKERIATEGEPDLWSTHTLRPKGNGSFMLERVPKARYTLFISAKGYAPYRVRGIEIKGDDTFRLPQDVKLLKGVHLKVKVLDLDGKLLEKAYVLVADTSKPPRVFSRRDYEGDRDRGWTWNTVRTGENGGSEFDSLAEGEYAVRAYHSDKGLSDEMTVKIKRGETLSLELNYKKPAALILEVVDKETGKPLSGVRTILHSTLPTLFGQDPRYKQSKDIIQDAKQHIYPKTYPSNLPRDDKGHIILPEWSKGNNVTLRVPGYRPATYEIQDIPAGKETPVKFQMEKLGTGGLKIKLIPGKGLELENIGEVHIQSISTSLSGGTSDEAVKIAPDKDGIVEMNDIPEGSCYISIGTMDKKVHLLSMFKAEIEKDRVNKVTLNLPGLGRVEGVLLDSDGNPLCGVELTLIQDSMMLSVCVFYIGDGDHGAFLYTTTTDREGRFSFDGIPEGAYLLLSRDQGAVDTRVMAGKTTKLRFIAQELIDVALTLKLPEGEKVPSDTTCYRWRIGTNPAGLLRVPSAHPDAEPTFRNGKVVLRNIFPGKWRLFIRLSDSLMGVTREIEIKPGTKEIEIPASFKPGRHTISGRFKSPGLSISSSAEGVGLLIAVGDKYYGVSRSTCDGSFFFNGLHPGKYRIIMLTMDDMCVNRAECYFVKEVTVEEGKDVEGITIP